jgi:hypothetical protein
MVETNAILAINSLDRYLTNQLETVTRFRCSYLTGTTQLVFLTPEPDTPIVGSICLGGVGLQVGTVITAYDSGTGIITIDRNTLSTQVNVSSIWTKTDTVSNYNDSLEMQYFKFAPYANDFSIQSAGSLIYGYITKIAVAQVQVQYYIPTVNLGLNDRFYISVSNAPSAGFTSYPITIPYGFYYADELAAIMQQLIIAADGTRFAGLLVTFFPRTGFVFNNTAANFTIAFPLPETIRQTLLIPRAEVTNIYKTYRLLGMTNDSRTFSLIKNSTVYPNFLYTPYIDFYSDVLTNYQKVKDTNTSAPNPKGLVARVYLSGVGSISTTGAVADTGRGVGQLGTEPFVLTADLNFPKIIRWTPDITVTSIDFQVRDCYGNLLPGVQQGFNTEFQMTLLCTEGDT